VPTPHSTLQQWSACCRTQWPLPSAPPLRLAHFQAALQSAPVGDAGGALPWPGHRPPAGSSSASAASCQRCPGLQPRVPWAPQPLPRGHRHCRGAWRLQQHRRSSLVSVVVQTRAATHLMHCCQQRAAKQRQIVQLIPAGTYMCRRSDTAVSGFGDTHGAWICRYSVCLLLSRWCSVSACYHARALLLLVGVGRTSLHATSAA
jgi:hypothetical protein